MVVMNATPNAARLGGLTETMTSSYIVRSNYGVVALKNKQVCAVEGYVFHTFHAVLPMKMETENSPQNVTSCALRHSGELCIKMSRLIDSVAQFNVNMRKSVRNLVGKIYRLLPDIRSSTLDDIWRDSGRKVRGLIDEAEYVLSWSFGLSTQAVVDEVAKEIDSIKGLAAASVANEQRAKTVWLHFQG